MLIPFLTFCYLALLALLLWVGSSRHLFHHYARAKTLASVGFLVLAPAAWLTGARTLPGSGFAVLLLALLLCAAGDILLGLANLHGGAHSRLFKVGVAAFGTAHLVFCALYYTEAPFHWFDLVPPVLAVLATAGLEKAGLLRLKKMRIPARCYSFLVGLMVTKAVGMVTVAGLLDARHLLLLVGSVLFILSDFILVFMYFGTRLTDRQRHFARFWNLTTYYLGVLLIALSLLY